MRVWRGYRAALLPEILRQFGGWDEDEQLHAFERRWELGGFSEVLLDGHRVGGLRLCVRAQAVEIADIWVRPEFQRQGIGRAVVLAVLEEARKAGRCVRLAVFLENPARHWYGRLGFQVVGRTEYQFLMQAT